MDLQQTDSPVLLYTSQPFLHCLETQMQSGLCLRFNALQIILRNSLLNLLLMSLTHLRIVEVSAQVVRLMTT